MPLIEVKMTKGRSTSQKVRFMKEVTSLACEILKCPAEAVSVIIDDHYDLNEWSVGGETWAEKVGTKDD